MEPLSKKKRRSRKRSESLSEGVGKRVRQPVGRPPKTKDLGSDSDDTSENSQTGTHAVNTESLINSRSQKPSKYNFYCELGEYNKPSKILKYEYDVIKNGRQFF